MLKIVALSLLALASSASCSVLSPRYRVSTGGCASACDFLKNVLQENITTTASDAVSYTGLQAGYYSSFNSELAPACFALPATAEEVALVVKTAKFFQCPFAVKSGGHSYFKGANSIQSGISIDLRRLNQITPNDDGTASIGPGNQWVQVYETLDPLGLTVMGGRVASIGVGGLLLSGGLSFLHPSQGFGCDHVRSYQIVTARGEILEVNEQNYSDLFWALRGGGNNFGIVTRFDLDTVPQKNYWGGGIYYDISQLDTLLAAYDKLAQPETADVKATTWFAPVYLPKLFTWLINVEPVYLDPVATTPEIFKPFIEAPGQISNTVRITNTSSLSRDTATTPGSASAEWDITMKMNTEVVYYIKQRIEEGALNHPALDVINFPVQALPKSTLSHTGNRGGNALGLSEADGPLLIVQLGLSWAANATTAADDDAIIALGETFVAELKQWSVDKGLAHRYIYMNYAGQNQDVFAGYGPENQARLKRVAKKYDPEGIFQGLLPGGKKLFST
ncbi:hypothetical protein ACN47E_001652 [Coniothyrium glycines]